MLTYETVAATDGARLTVGPDDGAWQDSPRGWANLSHLFYETTTGKYLAPDGVGGHPYEAAWEHFDAAIGKRREQGRDDAYDVFKRWLSICHPLAVVDTFEVHNDAPRLVGYIPAETVAREFDGDREQAASALASEARIYRAWAEGEVYVLAIEEQDDAGEWELVESVGSVYRSEDPSHDWEALARDLLNLASYGL